uniref:Uncharacterized protein n=1 Tax=Schistocephalus solidus TaxID=70667 RepID=A0A0V0J225_SCHSO
MHPVFLVLKLYKMADMNVLWFIRLQADLCFMFRIKSYRNLPRIDALTPEAQSYVIPHSSRVIPSPFCSTSKLSLHFASEYSSLGNYLPLELSSSLKVSVLKVELRKHLIPEGIIVIALHLNSRSILYPNNLPWGIIFH